MPDYRPVQLRDNAAKQRYEMSFKDGRTVFVTYEKQPGRIVLVHTEVPEELAGLGLASALARESLADIRRQGLRVVPRCPFIAKFIKRGPEYADLVDDTA